MLPYTATDLIEIIRRDIDTAASAPRIHTDKTPGFFQQLLRRTASRQTARR